jgi:hypothetical protein
MARKPSTLSMIAAEKLLQCVISRAYDFKIAAERAEAEGRIAVLDAKIERIKEGME